MMPAVYAQSAPSRNDWRAPAMIWLAYCGYCVAASAALEKDFVSSDCTLLLTERRNEAAAPPTHSRR